MRRFSIYLTAALVALLGAAVAAQGQGDGQGRQGGRGGGGQAGPPVVAPTTINTFMDHQNVMRSNAQANQAINKGLASGSVADAQMGAATLRTNFTTLRTFYDSKMRADAVTILTNALTQLDTLDTMLAAPMPDVMAAQAQAKMAQGACGACHMAYRTGDNQNGFRFTDPSILQ
jgi:hypothetical protein